MNQSPDGRTGKGGAMLNGSSTGSCTCGKKTTAGKRMRRISGEQNNCQNERKATMDQTIINWLLAGFGALIGFLLNAVWQAVKDLQAADTKLAAKVAEIEILVAGDYLRRDDFQHTVEALFKKLDKIEDKLDKKADKS